MVSAVAIATCEVPVAAADYVLSKGQRRAVRKIRGIRTEQPGAIVYTRYLACKENEASYMFFSLCSHKRSVLSCRVLSIGQYIVYDTT